MYHYYCHAKRSSRHNRTVAEMGVFYMANLLDDLSSGFEALIRQHRGWHWLWYRVRIRLEKFPINWPRHKGALAMCTWRTWNYRGISVVPLSGRAGWLSHLIYGRPTITAIMLITIVNYVTNEWVIDWTACSVNVSRADNVSTHSHQSSRWLFRPSPRIFTTNQKAVSHHFRTTSPAGVCTLCRGQ